jgi:hypothetical protein
MIAFQCPGCRITLQVQEDTAGRPAACPKCKTPFVVPAPGPKPQTAPAPAKPAPAPGAKTSSHEVFISYARKDDALVYPLVTRLRAHGVQLWLDKFDILPGDCFRTEISRAIDNCNLFLLMCSEHSLSSDFCFKEIAYASTRKRQVVSLWLCPPCPVPGRLALEIGPYHQIVMANRPVEAWLSELLQSLTASGVSHRGADFKPRHDPAHPERAQQWRTAVQAACQNREWQTAVDSARQYLDLLPNDQEIIAAASSASQWLLYEQNQHFSRICRSRSVSDWTDFLARYPSGPVSDHTRRKIAQLLPTDELDRYARLCQRNAAEDPKATGWHIAAAVCQFRLGNFKQGMATLDEIRAVAPKDAEMLFFRIVGALQSGQVKAAPDSLEGMQNHLRLIMGLVPDCGLPDVLAAIIARDYCEPHGIPCILGDSRSLLQRASAKGIGAKDISDLQALVGLKSVPLAAVPNPAPKPNTAKPPQHEPQPSHPAAQPALAKPLTGGAVRGLSNGAKWLIAAGVTLAVGGIAMVAIVNLSGNKSPGVGGKNRFVDIKLKVGDYIEFRRQDPIPGGKPLETLARFEVVTINGPKYQLRYTASLAGETGLSMTTDHDLTMFQYLPAQTDMDLDQLNKNLPQVAVGGKEMALGKATGKSKQLWRFEGKDYPCLVVAYEIGTSRGEVWYIDDPYFQAVLPGGVVRTVEGENINQVTAARFAARQ